MKKPTIYLAGPILMIGIAQATKNFEAAESFLKDEYNVISPIAHIAHVNEGRIAEGLDPLIDEIPADREQILRHCISLLALCDEVYMLLDWEFSEGATLEDDVAEAMGKKITYQLPA